MDSILQLPAELVRTILHFLDPESFYMCLKTSKVFRQHALASISLLQDQLARIPGQRLHWLRTCRDSRELLALFGRRAAQHLKNGAAVVADMHVWQTPPQTDRLNSIVVGRPHFQQEFKTDPLWSTKNALAFIEIQKEDATVNVHIIARGPGRQHIPREKHVISACSLAEHFPQTDEQTPEVEVVKATSIEGDYFNIDDDLPVFFLSVLYQAKAPSSTSTRMWLTLIVFRFEPKFGPIIFDTISMLSSKKEHVVAMCMSPPRNHVIVFRNYARGTHRVAYYAAEYDVNNGEYLHRNESSATMGCPEQSPWERVGGVTFDRGLIRLHPTTFPLPQWAVFCFNMSDPMSPVREESAFFRMDTSLPGAGQSFLRGSVGKIIAYHHHHEITDPDLNDGDPTCINTALRLVISRDNDPLDHRVGAFLLKAIHFPPECQEFHVNSAYNYTNLEHVFVARLTGLYDLSNLSNLGLRLAVSQRAHRIAIASWKTVRVWSLDPQAFLDPVYSSTGRDSVPGDYAYTEGSGWQFYRSEEFWRECVDLQPVELPSAGVVYGLEFRDEDELWGWTEEGLVRWDFGVMARGERGVSILDA